MKSVATRWSVAVVLVATPPTRASVPASSPHNLQHQVRSPQAPRLELATWHSRVRATSALRRPLLARPAEALASHVAASQTAYCDGERQRLADGTSDHSELLPAELEAQQAAAALSVRTVQSVAAEQALAGIPDVPRPTLGEVDLSWQQPGVAPSPSALPSPTLTHQAARNQLDLPVLPATARGLGEVNRCRESCRPDQPPRRLS